MAQRHKKHLSRKVPQSNCSMFSTILNIENIPNDFAFQTDQLFPTGRQSFSLTDFYLERKFTYFIEILHWDEYLLSFLFFFEKKNFLKVTYLGVNLHEWNLLCDWIYITKFVLLFREINAQTIQHVHIVLYVT